MRSPARVALFLATPAIGARAQQPDSVSQNPTAVAEAFFRAIAAAKWTEAAGYLDLETFEPYWRSEIEAERELPAVSPSLRARMAWVARSPSVLQLRRRGTAWRIIGNSDVLGREDTIIGIASCTRAPKR